MLTPSSYKDEPFAWRAAQSNERRRESRVDEEGADYESTSRRHTDMAEHSEESVPLLSGATGGGGGDTFTTPADSAYEDDDTVALGEREEEEASQRHPSGMTVNCRVCDAVIELEGRAAQHVVKCNSCMEATPIRPAPPGKKYVRCPCNCLLICKAASTRIACPRQNCRRVITLGQASTGTAVPAPTGTCRVSCAYCNEVFMFNTLTNTLATCPHCRKRSSVGSSFRRSRMAAYAVAGGALLLFSIIFSIVAARSSSIGWWWIGLLALFALTVVACFRAVQFLLCRVSTIVAPV